MDRPPQVTGAELLSALRKAGFEVVRQRGSHVQVRRTEPDGTVTTFPVPVHVGRTIKRGTLHGILRKAGIPPATAARASDHAPTVRCRATGTRARRHL